MQRTPSIRDSGQSRRSSTTVSAGLDIKPPPTPSGGRIHYTCLIRLPFARGSFVDPPQVEWDATKDKALWKIISKASNSKELDWEELSIRFEVSLQFLLQQAAWLYERHFAQMRAQMKKLGTSGAPSPVPSDSASSSATAGGVAMQRGGSRRMSRPTSIKPQSLTITVGSRAPSALSIHARDSPPPIDTSQPSSARAMRKALPRIVHPPQANKHQALPMSRTPSSRTVTQSRTGTVLPPSPRAPISRTFRGSSGSQSQRRPNPPLRPPTEDTHGEDQDDSPPPADEGSDSDVSSEAGNESASVARSQAFRRPSARLAAKSALSSDDEDDGDDDSAEGFLPFAAGAAGSKEDPAATLRTSPSKRNSYPEGSKANRPTAQPVESSASSASSVAAASANYGRRDPRKHGQPADALSPRRRAELAKLSPRLKKDGSEGTGTPSMGSSFSDLDGKSPY
ncbi:hypothetical protein M8818_005411 [Zalaria obscura]|uniref:Uncharacterized protein n=1 Tax=Zalaria obscura TaxID=2024903 RepID=A0ACC3S9N2_9PEZI